MGNSGCSMHQGADSPQPNLGREVLRKGLSSEGKIGSKAGRTGVQGATTPKSRPSIQSLCSFLPSFANHISPAWGSSCLHSLGFQAGMSCQSFPASISSSQQCHIPAHLYCCQKQLLDLLAPLLCPCQLCQPSPRGSPHAGSAAPSPARLTPLFHLSLPLSRLSASARRAAHSPEHEFEAGNPSVPAWQHRRGRSILWLRCGREFLQGSVSAILCPRVMLALARLEQMALGASHHENFLALLRDPRILIPKDGTEQEFLGKGHPCSSVAFHFLLSHSQGSTKHFLPQGHSWEQRAATSQRIMGSKARERKIRDSENTQAMHTAIVLELHHQHR